MPYMGKETTEGGVHVPDPVRDKEVQSNSCGLCGKSIPT